MQKLPLKLEMVVMELLVSVKKNIFLCEVLMEVMEVMAVPLSL